jgi:hypothetical protein
VIYEDVSFNAKAPTAITYPDVVSRALVHSAIRRVRAGEHARAHVRRRPRAWAQASRRERAARDLDIHWVDAVRCSDQRWADITAR